MAVQSSDEASHIDRSCSPRGSGRRAHFRAFQH